MSQKRIAVFNPTLLCGGAERVAINLTRGFVERGYAVDLVLGSAVGPLLADVARDVRIVNLNTKRMLACLPKLAKYLRRERPVALVSCADYANIIALWARTISRCDTRVIVATHCILSNNSRSGINRRSRMIPMLAKRFYPWADRIVAVSNEAAEDLAKTCGFARNRVDVIYNPVLMPEMYEKAENPAGHQFFSDPSIPVVVAVGRLTPVKDFPTLIRAFALVRERRNARLLILGEGDHRPILENLVRELGLEGDVAMPGFAQNPYASVSRATVFAMSSLSEALPTVLIEALGLGVPVVATDCPGAKEVLQDGKLGLLCPRGDAKGLANAINRAIEGNCPRAAAQALEAFSLEGAVQAYERLIA